MANGEQPQLGYDVLASALLVMEKRQLVLCFWRYLSHWRTSASKRRLNDTVSFSDGERLHGAACAKRSCCSLPPSPTQSVTTLIIRHACYSLIRYFISNPIFPSIRVMHVFVAERVYSALNSNSERSIGSNYRPNQRVIGLFIFIIVLVAVLRHFSKYTSQHSNANF